MAPIAGLASQDPADPFRHFRTLVANFWNFLQLFGTFCMIALPLVK